MRPYDHYALPGGDSVAIAPDWGANLFSWTVNGREIMYVPEGYPEAAFKITGGGNPLLFPAVGRTWDRSGDKPIAGPWRLAGSERVYSMPSHGIVYLSRFEKVEETVQPDAVSVTYRLNVPATVREENYPFDVGLTQRYTLKPGCVELESTVANNGDGPAPVAFGYHPYFRISNPRREGVTARLPAARRLLLTPDTVLLTGESEPTDGVLHLEPDLYYDQAFGEPTGNRMSLLDERAGHAIHVDFGDGFELFFAYAPDGADFFCIEPWTRGLGAFERLKEPGWEDGALIPVLQPGESRAYRATFSVEALA
jgi:aldose 1-epimerase